MLFDTCQKDFGSVQKHLDQSKIILDLKDTTIGIELWFQNLGYQIEIHHSNGK